jgi:TRAP-type mannitol/chloroaromatic compound transport system permease small subunit
MIAALLRVERVALTWSRRLALAGGWILLALAVATVFDAILRKLLNRPIQGTFEATELLLAVIIFFAMAYTVLTDGHVVLDLFTNRLSARAQSIVIGLNALFIAAVLAILAYELSLLAAEYGRTARTTITMRIPVFPVAAAVVTGAWLAALGAMIQALAAFARAALPRAARASDGSA